MRLTVIIPVFNEESTIVAVLKKVMAVSLGNVKKEIIIVDDGSTDKTHLHIQPFLKNYHYIHEIRLDKNRGKGYAVRQAIKRSTGDHIVIQDADLEYDPNELPKLTKYVDGHTVIYGMRKYELQKFSLKDKLLYLAHRSGTIFLSIVASILYNKSVKDITTGYKLFPTSAVDNISFNSDGFGFDAELTAHLLSSHLRFVFTPISYHPRNYGAGKKLVALTEGPQTLWMLLSTRFK